MNDQPMRRLIYCQTRKQCALIYNMFSTNLSKLYLNESVNVKERIAEIFHGGTSDDVKSYIVSEIPILKLLNALLHLVWELTGRMFANLSISVHRHL